MQLIRALFAAIALLVTFAIAAPAATNVPAGWGNFCGFARLYAKGNSRTVEGKVETLFEDAVRPSDLDTLETRFFAKVTEQFRTDDKLELTLYWNKNLFRSCSDRFRALRRRLETGLPRKGTTLVGKAKNAMYRGNVPVKILGFQVPAPAHGPEEPGPEGLSSDGPLLDVPVPTICLSRYEDDENGKAKLSSTQEVLRGNQKTGENK